jgi:hypothetical protein
MPYKLKTPGHALWVILIGTGIIILAEWAGSFLEEHSSAHTVILVATHIGVGVFAIGGLGILLERKHWTDYFEERLKSIVSGPDFIADLTAEKLKEVELNVFNSLFRNNRDGAAAGVFEYYKTHLQPALNDPYRLNVNFSLKLVHDATAKTFTISEELSWVCMSNGDSIQDLICWEYEKGEIERIHSSKISLRHRLHNIDAEIHNPHSTPSSIAKDNCGFNFLLSRWKGLEFKQLTGLEVVVMVEYQIPEERFISWSFSHLSKGVNISIEYPFGFKLFMQKFLVADLPGNVSKTQSNAETQTKVYELKSEFWFMADDGVAFQFIKEPIP